MLTDGVGLDVPSSVRNQSKPSSIQSQIPPSSRRYTVSKPANQATVPSILYIQQRIGFYHYLCGSPPPSVNMLSLMGTGDTSSKRTGAAVGFNKSSGGEENTRDAEALGSCPLLLSG